MGALWLKHNLSLFKAHQDNTKDDERWWEENVSNE
jgi:hypothetical protein